LYRARLDAWRHIKSANGKIPPIIGSSIEALNLALMPLLLTDWFWNSASDLELQSVKLRH
jgi:hypothetical protein